VRTLVIGGTRNLGPDLVGALLARGDAVTVLNRGLTPAALPDEVRRLTADRRDAAALRAKLAGLSFDLVVDTTLYTGDDATVVTTLLEAAVGRYVWWSTGQVYLVRNGVPRPFREHHYDGPIMGEPAAKATLDHRNWVYGVEKRHAEDVFLTAWTERRFPVVSLRMPMIASERDHHTRIAAYVRRMRDGGPILVPDTPPLPVRHVYGKDVVAATLRAAEAPDAPGKAFNVSQDETLELTEILGRISSLAGGTARLLPLPRVTLEAAGVLPGCSPFSDPWMSALDNTRSKTMLGVQYTPLEAYLPRCVEAALAVAPERVVGYEKRRVELALAAQAI
jgi:nucleoside-diphosphate-sugar epimerase